MLWWYLHDIRVLMKADTYISPESCPNFPFRYLNYKLYILNTWGSFGTRNMVRYPMIKFGNKLYDQNLLFFPCCVLSVSVLTVKEKRYCPFESNKLWIYTINQRWYKSNTKLSMRLAMKTKKFTLFGIFGVGVVFGHAFLERLFGI